LRNEGEFGNIVGKGSQFVLTRTACPHIKVNQAGGMANSNCLNTPTTGKTVGADINGPVLNEEWEYS